MFNLTHSFLFEFCKQHHEHLSGEKAMLVPAAAIIKISRANKIQTEKWLGTLYYMESPSFSLLSFNAGPIIPLTPTFKHIIQQSFDLKTIFFL